MKTSVMCVLLLVSIAYVIVDSAKSDYDLRILPERTVCNSDGTMLIYYQQKGYQENDIVEGWTSGSAFCTIDEYIPVEVGHEVNRIIGWIKKCIMSTQRGIFTVSYKKGVNCFLNTDTLELHTCSDRYHLCGEKYSL